MFAVEVNVNGIKILVLEATEAPLCEFDITGAEEEVDDAGAVPTLLVAPGMIKAFPNRSAFFVGSIVAAATGSGVLLH